jgi:segregation and condensation protein B
MNLKLHLESILLLSVEELKISELCKFFKKNQEEMIDILNEIKEERKNTGINLEIGRENVYLITNPASGEIVHRFFNQESKPKKLSGAALETLSIIAYRQPVTKSEIEAIRGVAVEGVVQNLEDKKLIRVCGKKDGIGRPNLYGVTDRFFSYLKINSIEELPNYIEVKEYIERENESK